MRIYKKIFFCVYSFFLPFASQTVFFFKIFLSHFQLLIKNFEIILYFYLEFKNIYLYLCLINVKQIKL